MSTKLRESSCSDNHRLATIVPYEANEELNREIPQSFIEYEK